MQDPFRGEAGVSGVRAYGYRESINGLAGIVEGSFRLDPFGEALFVFCNRTRDRLKILEWDGDGSGCTSSGWRRDTFGGRARRKALTAEDLTILLGGAKVELKPKRNEGRQLIGREGQEPSKMMDYEPVSWYNGSMENEVTTTEMRGEIAALKGEMAQLKAL